MQSHRNIRRFFISGLPLDEESLSDVREVEIEVKFGCDPYFRGFDPTVIRRCKISEIGFPAVLEVKLNRLDSYYYVGG